jgi:hypothetical protein
MMLCEKQHREEEKTKTVNMAFETQNKWKQSTGFVGWFDEIPQKSNTYTFRGPINIAHIVSDCMRDGKQAFLAIGDEVVMGVSKQLSVPFPYMGFLFNDCEESKGSPFFYGVINKNDIPKAIKFLKDIDQKIKKDIRTVAKQIAKDKKAGKFSNAPETKVLTF